MSSKSRKTSGMNRSWMSGFLLNLCIVVVGAMLVGVQDGFCKEHFSCGVFLDNYRFLLLCLAQRMCKIPACSQGFSRETVL